MKNITIGQIVRGDREVFPPYLYEAYQSTRRRAPMLPLIEVPLTLSELTGPGPAISAITLEDADLTRNSGTVGEAIGQRIIVTGRVLDDRGFPVPNTLLEIWQANAAGRYLHKRDQWPGPLDPIMNAVPTETARKRLIAMYDHHVTEQEWALGYRWDIVVRGAYATPFESKEDER